MIFATTGLSWSSVREDGVLAVREISTPRVWKEPVNNISGLKTDSNTYDGVPALQKRWTCNLDAIHERSMLRFQIPNVYLSLNMNTRTETSRQVWRKIPDALVSKFRHAFD